MHTAVGGECHPGAPAFVGHALVRLAALSYTAVVSLGICYLTWFAALRRVEAGTAAIGMLLTPIVGVMASAISLGEPLLFPQIASLVLVIAGVSLAVRQA